MGCRVECCEEGDRAIELSREAFQRGAGFDVVLLDVSLPGGLDGAGTPAGLRAVDPGVKVIVCSGQGTEHLMGRCREQGLFGVLAKPLRFEQLQELLCRALASDDANIHREAKIRNPRKGKGRPR